MYIYKENNADYVIKLSEADKEMLIQLQEYGRADIAVKYVIKKLNDEKETVDE